jgi:RimJ/RimL family protein N-acetyltransferase
MNWLFYAFKCPGSVRAHGLDPRFTTETWAPTGWQTKPPGLALWPFGAWWAFHKLKVFRNQNYSLILVRDRADLIHRSCVFPGYFRFPFMAPADLQVGDVWTATSYRGSGLATFGLERAIEVAGGSVRRIWYVVEEKNVPSIKLVEKVGFTFSARGTRNRVLGTNLLGSFELGTQDRSEGVSS